MDNNCRPGVKEIASPIRAKDGKIISFELKNKTTLSRQQAVLEAQQGRLIGINLYPGFVKDVLKQPNDKGLLKKIIKYFKEKG